MTYDEMLAVAMSVLQAHEWEVEAAAAELGVILDVSDSVAAELTAEAMEEWSDIYAE